VAFIFSFFTSSSMVIRDLTLRSAASFGSFHLIRLLYDEYMFYLIEHRVAQATGETPIAVMGEFLNLSQRSKEEDDASIPSPASGSGSGSLHVGITASAVGASGKSNHVPMVQLDGSSSAKRSKLS
jgi:regulatory factor X 1/2/3